MAYEWTYNFLSHVFLLLKIIHEFQRAAAYLLCEIIMFYQMSSDVLFL